MKLRRGTHGVRSIELTHEEAVLAITMLESFLAKAHELGGAVPPMPCEDAWCGYALCQLMRLLQKERDNAPRR
jgi:hypothetical protein